MTLLEQMMQDQQQLEQAAGSLEVLTAAARELVQIEAEVKLAEKALETAKAERNRLRHERLPAILGEANTDRIGIPDMGLDAVLERYVHANIPADWDEPRREAAFAELERCGAEQIIRIEVSCFFGKEEYAEAKKLEERLLKAGYSPTLKKGVPWNTLTAWVKELLAYNEDVEDESKKRPVPNFDLIGALVGMIVKLVKRKK